MATRATLNEMPTRTTHDLTMLLRAVKGDKIEIGRADEDSKALILLGENSENKNFGRISKAHATIVYDPNTDTYTLVDHSRYGTKIGEDLIHNNSQVLGHEDLLRFGGYGPVFFFQEEVKTMRSDTRMIPKVE